MSVHPLPAMDVPLLASLGRARVSSPASDPSARCPVFLIDGDHAVRDAVASALRAAGFAVVPYVSAEQFLARTGGGRGCLLVDLDLPGMSGIGLLDRLAECRRPLPAILMSGRLSTRFGSIRRLCPGVRVLEKPFGEDELIAMIAATLGDT